MIGTLLISIAIFILFFSIVVITTEGFKVTLATIIGSFGLTWAFLVNLWSSYEMFVINPALNVIFGAYPLTFYNIGATMLFIAWCFVIFISLINILLTMNRGSVKIFQNITESKEDNL